MVLFIGCASAPPPKPLPIFEQIVLDTEQVKEVQQEFQKRINRANEAEVQLYLTLLARQIAKQEPGFEENTVEVKLIQDAPLSQKRFFAFPGTRIFIPVGFLHQVEYENELAAAIAFELANVIHRHLAKRIDQAKVSPVLFGQNSIFELSREDRKESIQKATQLLYRSKFEQRGLASYFQRYMNFADGGWNQDSELRKKEVEFNIKEAQRARSQFSPLRDPVVRSSEFILMKKRMR